MLEAMEVLEDAVGVQEAKEDDLEVDLGQEVAEHHHQAILPPALAHPRQEQPSQSQDRLGLQEMAQQSQEQWLVSFLASPAHQTLQCPK